MKKFLIVEFQSIPNKKYFSEDLQNLYNKKVIGNFLDKNKKEMKKTCPILKTKTEFFPCFKKMKKIIYVLLLVFPVISYSQTIYVNSLCKEECDKCAKKNPPMKVTYKVDKNNNKVFRIIDDKDADVINDCTVIDENNWVCKGFPSYSDYSKQYAVKGVAFWNESPPTPDFDKKYGYKYSCRYEKSFMGNYKVTNQIKKY